MLILLVHPLVYPPDPHAESLSDLDLSPALAAKFRGFVLVEVASLVAYLLAFGLFRAFDIFKPWPVNAFEKLPGGWGVMMDDLMAGVYGALVLYALRHLAALPL